MKGLASSSSPAFSTDEHQGAHSALTAPPYGALVPSTSAGSGEVAGEAKRPASMPRAEYRTWWNMLRRCDSPTNKNWINYGGRGISVCDRWRVDFWAFYDDMGPRPSSRHSIDRIDNDGNYEPGNCRWATHDVQCKNRAPHQRRESRGSRRLTLNGVTRSVAAWARVSGVHRTSFEDRLRRGWSLFEAVNGRAR